MIVYSLQWWAASVPSIIIGILLFPFLKNSI